MKVYLIWAINLDPEIDTTDRDSYVEQRPNAAQYLPFWLFPEMKENIAGLTCPVVDLSDQVLEQDITHAAFLTMCDSLIVEERSGRCVVLSLAQGRYLYEQRYAPVED